MDDESALKFVKEVHEAKEFKFSSECLEILLKRHFENATNYLLEEYYPKTQIDTEVIVRSVSNDVKRQQNYILFKLMRQREDKKRLYDPSVPAYPPVITPMVYQAQSPADVHFLVRIQESFEDLDCSNTYEQEVKLSPTEVFVSAVCFESESNVHLFQRTIQLPQPINPEMSHFSWDADGKVHI